MPPIDKTKDLSLLLVAALLGGGAGSYGINASTNSRPDPFTGTEGKAMASQIHSLEKEMHGMRLELGRESRAMPAVRRLEYRLNTFESNYRDIKECCDEAKR